MSEEKTNEVINDDIVNKDVEDSNVEIDYKEMSRKWERRSKENFEKAKEKSDEASELLSKINKLEKEKNEMIRQNTINEVASKYGLGDVLAKRLTGETLEELEADAAELADLFVNSGSDLKTVKKVQPVKNQGESNDSIASKGTFKTKKDYEDILRAHIQ